MVILQYMIKNDSFQEKTCLALINKNTKPHPLGIANLNRDTIM